MCEDWWGTGSCEGSSSDNTVVTKDLNTQTSSISRSCGHTTYWVIRAFNFDHCDRVVRRSNRHSSNSIVMSRYRYTYRRVCLAKYDDGTYWIIWARSFKDYSAILWTDYWNSNKNVSCTSVCYIYLWEIIILVNSREVWRNIAYSFCLKLSWDLWDS